MAHKKKCANCGHKIEMKNGELIHLSPHPSFACPCTKPELYTEKTQRKLDRVNAGISTISGYISKENNNDNG